MIHLREETYITKVRRFRIRRHAFILLTKNTNVSNEIMAICVSGMFLVNCYYTLLACS